VAPLLSCYRKTAPLPIESMWVHLNYVPGEKKGLENNKADYYSRHPEPLTAQESQASKNQAKLELRETVEEFQKDIMAIVKSSVPQVVTWQELLEETHPDTPFGHKGSPS